MGSLSEHEGLWDGVGIDLCERTYVPNGQCCCGYHTYIDNIEAERVQMTEQEGIWCEVEYKMRLKEAYRKGGRHAEQLGYEALCG